MTRTAAETRHFVKNYIRDFNARDFDSVLAAYADDANLEDPVGSEVHRGKTAIRAFYDNYLNQPSFLQLTGDFRYAGSAVAFSFFCYLGTGADPMIVQITDSFRFDEHGRIREMRAFWGEANIHGVDNRSPEDGGQLPLAGRVGLVRGDGPVVESCVRLLSARGATLILTGDRGEALAERIFQSGGRALAIGAHDADGPRKFGRLDFCVDVLVGGAVVTGMAGGGDSIVRIVDADSPPDLAIDGPVQMNSLRVRSGIAPDMVAETAVWLVSPAARAVRGQTIDLS